ncbi:MAG TPA: hypothetical protein VH325_18720 [Bryobacteraceae bacterium]|nr:hypothetical protein [Bryobacteraceae bacterium]
MCRPYRSTINNALFAGLFVTAALSAVGPITIRLLHNSSREAQTKATLEQVLDSYDLRKYTFTRKVIIEERAINHAFPELTLNTRFANSADELLSSYIHEQLHWYLRDHDYQQRAAISILRRMYPTAPVGLPEGAESAYSTYGHLVDCYLEIEADRRLIGPERTMAVIKDKGHYTWIYSTILRDEPRIAAVVDDQHLRIN